MQKKGEKQYYYRKEYIQYYYKTIKSYNICKS